MTPEALTPVSFLPLLHLPWRPQRLRIKYLLLFHAFLEGQNTFQEQQVSRWVILGSCKPHLQAALIPSAAV